MKKVLIIIVAIISITAVIVQKDYKDENIVMAYSNLVEKHKKVEGMKVVLFGGSNEPDKGNTRCMGYMVKTRNDQIIFIDGGFGVDYELIKSYIDKYGNGIVNHLGALIELLSKDNDIIIENLYYNLLTEEWYKKYDERGFTSEKALLDSLGNEKIKNKIVCEKGQRFKIDNVEVEIIRVADETIIDADNGNEASMTFKLTATDVRKSMIFLGDSMTRSSKELLNSKEKLKADAVQMAHHGNWGVTKEVYEAINPEVAFFNAPENLYNNDSGGGFNTGPWSSVIVRGWLDEIGVKEKYVAFEGTQMIHFNSEGIQKVDETAEK